MRCKVGDLAVIVRSMAGNEGKIVKCVEWLPKQYFAGILGIHDAWGVDQLLNVVEGGPRHNRIPDAWLRPIKDSDGEDEMLRIAGLPIKEKAYD